MVTPLEWTDKGQIIKEISDMPEGTYGFIYETLHIPTNKKYIGKKVLYFERNKRLGKRALEALRDITNQNHPLEVNWPTKPE